MQDSFPTGYKALVIGASGSIGSALVSQLERDPNCSHVTQLHRHSEPPIDMADEASIANAAQAVATGSKLHLIIVATGMLHSQTDATVQMPERRIQDLNAAHLAASFQVNAIGPALVLRYFAPILDRAFGRMVFLSAKVGSIGDNRLGGWYSYRASKAALNMLVKTASIELKRTQPQTAVVAMHPGTVTSKLSAPFGGATKGRDPAIACTEMLGVINQLTPADSGKFLSYSGEELPW